MTTGVWTGLDEAWSPDRPRSAYLYELDKETRTELAQLFESEDDFLLCEDPEDCLGPHRVLDWIAPLIVFESARDLRIVLVMERAP